MTITQIIKEKGFSRYSLSKTSGVPWATLADICSGKTSLRRCSASTLMKLSKPLGLSLEEILALDTNPHGDRKQGKPADKSYLEINLSPALTKAIGDYVQGEKEHSRLLDCLWGELYGSINADFWAGCITEEQADYLRKKYLFGENQEESPQSGPEQSM